MNAEMLADMKAIISEVESVRFNTTATAPVVPIHEQAVNAGIDPSLILFIIQTFGPAAIRLLEMLIERRKKK